MASSRTYKATGIVLRKTKLGERDLIVTFILESGELLKAVAKGARKPGGSFSSKLELFTSVDFMAAHGQNLSIITEARFSKNTAIQTFGLEQAACASAVAELLATVCQEGLEQPRLHDLAKEAFRVIAASDPETALAVSAAALLKAISMVGYRPTLDQCVNCGEPLDTTKAYEKVLFSIEHGGIVCPRCAPLSEGTLEEGALLTWMRTLLYSRLADIEGLRVPPQAASGVLQSMQLWTGFYVGKRLKSVTYLLSCGLF